MTLKAPLFAHDGTLVCGYGAPPANRGVLLAPRAPFAYNDALLVDAAPLPPAKAPFWHQTVNFSHMAAF